MNYLPNNLTFNDGVAFLNKFSLIDIASEQRYDTGESSAEDIFLTDDEECDENIPVQSPSAEHNLHERPAADFRRSNSFSKENNNSPWEANTERQFNLDYSALSYAAQRWCKDDL